ncbi:hypothetical protein [Pararhizobium antarcticum]|nr:hypothetical protein [Pararhizobium antarcticum]
MQPQLPHDHHTAAAQLRPVVVTVVTLKIMVFALLMTTLNLPAPIHAPVEIASIR